MEPDALEGQLEVQCPLGGRGKTGQGKKRRKNSEHKDDPQEALAKNTS
jgi:hypothetical protein